MAGCGDKGLLITTGTFRSDAKREATRDGAPPRDLIDGDRLCERLKRYELGVKTEARTVEDAYIEPTFFAESELRRAACGGLARYPSPSSCAGACRQTTQNGRAGVRGSTNPMATMAGHCKSRS